MRTVFGQSRWSDISRFISEIPDTILDMGTQAKGSSRVLNRAKVDEFDQLTYCEHDSEEITDESDTGSKRFKPGTKVNHATFGEGEVVSSDGAGSNQKLTVLFPGVGRKVIVARFVEQAGYSEA